MLTEAIEGYVIDTWGNGTVEGEYVLTGFAGTLISCYFLWRSRDFKETPAQLAKTLSYFYENLPEVNRI